MTILYHKSKFILGDNMRNKDAIFCQNTQSGKKYVIRGNAVYGSDESPVIILEEKDTGKVVIVDDICMDASVYKDGQTTPLYIFW